MTNNNRSSIAWLCTVCLLLLCSCGFALTPSRQTVRIAIPYEEQLSGIEDGYYKSWLEAQSQLDIEFVFIPQTYTKEYLRMLCSSSSPDIDGVFFSKTSAPTAEELAIYGSEGKLASLNTLIDGNSQHLSHAMAKYPDYDLRQVLTEADGQIYYMPALEISNSARYLQTMWINIAWLEELNLTLPTTTQEFAEVLAAFAKAYPSGVPLIGSWESANTNPCSFLMNSFALCDAANYYMEVKEDEVFYPPTTVEWREGLRYCKELYDLGLLPEQSFTFTKDQLIGICNDPRNLVGAFTAKSMPDILSEQTPQLISQYFALAPLKGPKQSGVAIVEAQLPRPGGIILASSPKKEAVFRLMDIMCSEDAFLIGHFGEPDVDWEKAARGDISVNGTPAVISIKTSDRLQRKDAFSAVLGPFITRTKYTDGVAWKGYQVNQSAYIQARAYRINEPYEGKESIGTIYFPHNSDENQQKLETLAAYTEDWMKAFITGRKDLESDVAWQQYQAGFKELWLDEMIASVQQVYDEREGR